jgi:signal peptidase I
MEPTLHCAKPGSGCEADSSDRIVVKPASKLQHGDIAVFTTPHEAMIKCGAGGTFVKRVMGIGGDVIRERSGFFYVNGRKLDDSSYVAPGSRDTESGVWRVPEGGYFFVGDNRSSSCDSRRWGWVPAHNIQGKVVAIKRGSGTIDLP